MAHIDREDFRNRLKYAASKNPRESHNDARRRRNEDQEEARKHYIILLQVVISNQTQQQLNFGIMNG
jgi:hypothetical protein